MEKIDAFSTSQVGSFVQFYLIVFVVAMELLAEYYEPSSFTECVMNSAQMPYMLLRATCLFQILRTYNRIMGVGENMKAFCDRIQNILFILSFYVTQNHWAHFRSVHYEKNEITDLTKFTLDMTHGFGALMVMAIDLILYSGFEIQEVHKYFLEPFVCWLTVFLAHQIYMFMYGISQNPQIKDLHNDSLNLISFAIIFCFIGAFLKSRIEFLRDYISDESNFIPKKFKANEGETYGDDKSEEEMAYLKKRNYWMKKDVYEEKNNNRK